MTKTLTDVFAVLGVVWTVLTSVLVGIFFLGGEWQEWKAIKQDWNKVKFMQSEEYKTQFVRYGDGIVLYYKKDHMLKASPGGKAETTVTLHADTNPKFVWTVKK